MKIDDPDITVEITNTEIPECSKVTIGDHVFRMHGLSAISLQHKLTEAVMEWIGISGHWILKERYGIETEGSKVK